MKRILLRVLALGFVVVLGVIAIAHAQRASVASVASNEPAPDSSATVAANTPRPGLISAVAEGNPLRGARRVMPVDQTPPSMMPSPPTSQADDTTAVRLASHEEAAPPVGAGTAVAVNESDTLPSQETGPAKPRTPADPFGLRSSGEIALAPPVHGQAATRVDTIPDARAVSNLAPDRQAIDDKRSSDVQVLAPPGPQTAGVGAAANPGLPAGSNPLPTERYAASARGGDRYAAASRDGVDPYGGVLRPGSETQEPAVLKADPFASPAAPVNRPGALRPEETTPGRAESASMSLQNDSAPRGTAAPNGMGPSSAEPVDAARSEEGLGLPGDKQLEGPQSPQLSVQKFAPAEIQVGKPATFRVVVRNTGNVAAGGVEVHDQIPKGTRVTGTTPRASRGVRGELVWTLGTIKPGEEATVEAQLMPMAEGEIGSVATVVFNADASARAIATRPQLAVETTAADKVLIGESVTLTIVVSNPGTGIATGVVVEEHIPTGLQQPNHPNDPGLQYEVGDMRPGESRKLELPLLAKQPGPVTNVLTVRGDGNLRAEGKCSLEVIAPQLDIALEGPKKRYLEREATYQVSLRNPGTAPAERVELTAYLPTGLKFVSANNAGHYDEVNRAVCWRLDELPVNAAGTVELVTLPVEAGQHSIKLLSTANRGLKVEKEQPVIIDGIAAILFQASSTVNPVEVGGETTYEIHVINQGSKAASNVRLVVTLPAEMKPVAAEGPSRNMVEGSSVSFEGLARLAPKADTTYRIRAQALRPGDLRTRIQLMTDEMSGPVTKEESTRVYADE